MGIFRSIVGTVEVTSSGKVPEDVVYKISGEGAVLFRGALHDLLAHTDGEPTEITDGAFTVTRSALKKGGHDKKTLRSLEEKFAAAASGREVE